MKTIVLTGGGTGGHVIPNLSLIPLLKKHFSKIAYIGTNAIEKDLVGAQKDVEFFEIRAPKTDRTHILKNVLLPFKLFGSIKECKKILKKLKPDVVFSKGGYVSVPVCIAAKMLGIKIVGHESDLTLGKANKLIYRLSQTFCTTFEKTSQNLKKGVFTGSPIRKQLFEGNAKIGFELTNFDASRPVVMITGGSTGASDINNVVFNGLEELTKNFDIIHLVGKNKGRKITNKHYCQMEFCPHIEHLFAISDVVVSRAGSNAIFELLALNKKMILVPLPKGNSRGDQVENAQYFARLGFARVVEQKNLSPSTLVEEIKKALENKNIHSLKAENLKLLTNGSQNIVDEILKVAEAKSLTNR